MKHRALVSEGTVLRLMQAAQQAYIRRDFEECFDSLARANRMAPANINILLDTGGFRVRRYENEKAAEYFDRAIKLSPRKTATLIDAGIRCRDAASFELAKRYLEQAATQNDVTADGLAALAWVYERVRRMDDANAAADRALKISPDSPAAILVRARLDHLAGKNAEAEARLKVLSARGDSQMRVRAYYDLGTVLDRQKRYDEAMEAFLQAKALLRANSARQAEELKITRARLRTLAESLTPEILRRWAETRQSLQPALRLALLGGHPRSGTTLLEQVVDAHPDIISAEETDVFNDDAFNPLVRHIPHKTPMLEELEQTTTSAIQSSRNNYMRRMEIFLGQPVGGRLLIDKNPSLTFQVPAMARIFPEIKFLIALRDPRDVCMSCFMQPLLLNQVSYAWTSIEGSAQEYIDLIGNWRKIAPLLPNPTLEVRYEDMVEDLETVARKTLDFLGVAWDPKVLGFDEHARQKAVRSPTYSDVTKKVFKTAVGRWRNYQKYFEPHLAKLEPLVKELGYE
jgi:tetratricopeptide (TPR) repeat protein